MEPEEKNVILTPELLQEIVELASTTAVESYQKELDKAKREAKREREEARKKNLYNTRILLENYRGFVEHSKKAVYDASQVTEDEDLDKLVEELMSGPALVFRWSAALRRVQPAPAQWSCTSKLWLPPTRLTASTPRSRSICAATGRFITSISQMSARMSSKSLLKKALMSLRCTATARLQSLKLEALSSGFTVFLRKNKPSCKKLAVDTHLPMW